MHKYRVAWIWLLLACSAGRSGPPAEPAASPAPVATAETEAGEWNEGRFPTDTTGAVVALVDTTSRAFLRQRREEAAIPTANGMVSRVGGELHVRLKGGRTAIYPPQGHDDGWHYYVGYVAPIRSHIINALGFAGSGAFLVVDDSTGDTTTTLWSAPVLSPDRSRFLVMSMAGIADDDANLIEVWRVVRGKPEREFSLEPEDWEPSDPVWRDSATIDFMKNTPVPERPEYTQTPARLQRVNDQWIVTDR